MLRDNKHEFAVFFANLATNKSTLTITDKAFVQRIAVVLRLKKGDSFTLFNKQIHATACIETIDKKSVTVTLDKAEKNKQTTPNITFLLPVLKREALESAVYSCTALGASLIQLVTTEKTRKWSGSKELGRLERISIAAAEQSKNFAFPDIKEPIDLPHALKEYHAHQLFFADPLAEPLARVLETKKITSKQKLCLLVGPEGDLTTAEKDTIKKSATLCALTDTILRSEQALALFLGYFRVALKTKIGE